MKENLSKKAWLDFLKLCTEIDSFDEMGSIFDLFFTLEEKQNFSSRYLIIQALLEGKLTQRDIAETCKVSIAQITRGSNALKIISPNIKEKLKAYLF